MTLESRKAPVGTFFGHLAALGAARDAAAEEALHRALLEAWGEPHRHYHTEQHLKECLELLERWGEGLSTTGRGEVPLAIWFHDAIYDTRASDSEQRSAAWAVTALTALHVPPASVTSVQDLVLATRHAAPDADIQRSDSAAVLVDIDLAILGAEPARFAEYEAQVRLEYGWLSDAGFDAGRREFLESMLARDRLFMTPRAFREREAAARRNIAARLARTHSQP
jgi:predicted metal-dependent HD superfamily phosphohydrolase